MSDIIIAIQAIATGIQIPYLVEDPTRIANWAALVVCLIATVLTVISTDKGDV